MHWIVQEDFLLGKPGWADLVDTLNRFGVEHSFHKVTPRTGELTPEAEVGHTNVFCYGSYSMRHVASRLHWRPGIFDLFHQDFEQQRAHWGKQMLNFPSVVCELAQANCSGDKVFVRPVADTKSFTGRLFEKFEFEEWMRRACDRGGDSPASSSLRKDTLVQVCDPVEIHGEYRCWIVKGQVVTSSVYRRGGQAFFSDEVDDRVVAYAQDRVAEWQPHEAFVLDVCDTPVGMRVVEINTINCSAFYAADVQRLVGALEDAFSV